MTSGATGRGSRFDAVWHAQSTLLLDAPRCFATPTLLRMMLAAGSTRLVYAGDRMWPAIDYGQTIEITAAGPESALALHDPVIVSSSGIPDLLRVSRIDGDELSLSADGDPDVMQRVSRDAVLARAQLPGRSVGRPRRIWRRIRLDLREASRHAPDDDSADPADTVREKYELQAPFYSRVVGDPIDPPLRAWISARVVPGGRVLVVGSGAGKESIELARMGYRVRGVDFAPGMVELARAAAADAGVDVRFDATDVRSLELEPGQLDAVFFTYDVYSFVPTQADRLGVLRAIRGWLRPGGGVLLSARRVRGLYARAVLSWQWFCRRRRGDRVVWGDSHTRYVGLDGRQHRSYVHVFDQGAIRGEIADSGFVVRDSHAGHLELRLAPDHS